MAPCLSGTCPPSSLISRIGLRHRHSDTINYLHSSCHQFHLSFGSCPFDDIRLIYFDWNNHHFGDHRYLWIETYGLAYFDNYYVVVIWIFYHDGSRLRSAGIRR